MTIYLPHFTQLKQQKKGIVREVACFGAKWIWKRPKYVRRIYGFPCVSLLNKWLLLAYLSTSFQYLNYVTLSDMVSPKMDCGMTNQYLGAVNNVPFLASILTFSSTYLTTMFQPHMFSRMFVWIMKWEAYPAGCQVCGLRPLDYRYRRFEPAWGHSCSFHVFVVHCVGSGLCDEPISRPEDFYRPCVCVSNYVWYRNLNS